MNRFIIAYFHTTHVSILWYILVCITFLCIFQVLRRYSVNRSNGDPLFSVRGYNFLFVYKNGLTGKGNEHIETGIIPCHVRVRLKRNLMMLMNEKAIYRNPDLRLSLLAKELNTNRTYLSSLIKADFGNSYAGFINHYRVNEAKKLLVDTENNMSINEISEKVGFKSVSSFNIFFKRFTGKTPATFRRLGAKSRLISAIK